VAIYCADAAYQITWREKDTVEHADPKLRYDRQLASLEAGIPSHGQRQSRVVDKEGVIEG